MVRRLRLGPTLPSPGNSAGVPNDRPAILTITKSPGSHATTMARYARRPAGPRRPQGPWKHGMIPVLGLVGGIGAGKTLVAADLAARGARVLDADAVGHALLEQRPARDEVLAQFGPDVLGPDDTIDRHALGAIVFARPAARRELEAILHPRMRRTFERAIDRAARKEDAPAVVLDAAILFEAGWHDLCDRVAFVAASSEVRLARLAGQRGWDAATLAAREQAQLTLETKRQRADFVVRNDAGPEELRSEVDVFWTRLVPPRRDRPTSPSARRARPSEPTGAHSPSPGPLRSESPPTDRPAPGNGPGPGNGNRPDEET